MREPLRQVADHLASQGHSHKTVLVYLGWLGRMQRWARLHGTDLETLSPADVLAYTENQVPLSRSARVQVKQAVRAWCEATGREDQPWEVVRVPRESAPMCRALEPGDARALFHVARTWDAGPEGLAVLLGQQQGLRRAEIAHLEWSGLDWGKGTLTFVGKGPKRSTVPLHPVTLEALTWWQGYEGSPRAQCRTMPGSEYVFDGRAQGVDERTCKPVHPNSVWNWVKRVGAHAGLELTTHQLRHTFGAELNDNTGNLRLAQELMRHSKVTTTQRYTRVPWSSMVDGVMAVDYS